MKTQDELYFSDIAEAVFWADELDHSGHKTRVEFDESGFKVVILD